MYTSAIRILAKGYLPNTLVTPLKLKEILNEVRMALQTYNPDYDLVINRLHPVLIQPYTQQPLMLYQLETVPVPIIIIMEADA